MTKNNFFKSIKCHTFSEPQVRSDLNDDYDDNDDNDDINDDNMEEDDNDKNFFFKSISCYTFSRIMNHTFLFFN